LLSSPPLQCLLHHILFWSLYSVMSLTSTSSSLLQNLPSHPCFSHIHCISHSEVDERIGDEC
jgi:uncharacterized membrane protein